MIPYRLRRLINSFSFSGLRLGNARSLRQAGVGDDPGRDKRRRIVALGYLNLVFSNPPATVKLSPDFGRCRAEKVGKVIIAEGVIDLSNDQVVQVGLKGLQGVRPRPRCPTPDSGPPIGRRRAWQGYSG